MEFNGFAVPNPVGVERVTTPLQIRNEPLGALNAAASSVDIFHLEKDYKLTVLRITWDGLLAEENENLMSLIGSAVNQYVKITSTHLRGNSVGTTASNSDKNRGGEADSEYVTLRPGSKISNSYEQERMNGLYEVNDDGDILPPLVYRIQAEFLTYPYTT